MKNKTLISSGVISSLLVAGLFTNGSIAQTTSAPTTSGSTSGSGTNTTKPDPCATPGGDPSKTCSGAGNPLNVANGNKYQREVDMAPLPGVLGLEIVRHYNSAYSGQGNINGIMGRGWKLSYETELKALSNSVELLLADGETIVFARSPLSRNHCATLDPSQGTISIVHTDRGDEYVWSKPSGQKLNFNTKGKLVQISVPTGEFVTLQHDMKGHLVKVTDPQGRSLELSYLEPSSRSNDPSKPRFSGVQYIDSPMGRFSYQYGGSVPNGSKASPVDVVANLVHVNRPAGPQSSAMTGRRYFYEDAQHPTLLTGIAIDGGTKGSGSASTRIATFAYDQRGWAIRSEHGTSVELLDLRRAVGFSKDTTGRAVLIHSKDAAHPQGQALEVLTAQINGQYRIIETRGVACPVALNCPAGNVRYEYDSLGRATSVKLFAPPATTFSGKEWQFEALSRPLRADQYEYDIRGRLTQHVEVNYPNGSAQGRMRLVAAFQYDGESDRVSLLRTPSLVTGQWRDVVMRYNDAGQVTQLSEKGWVPSIAGRPAYAIERSTYYGYTRVNGRSVLSTVDGPLPGNTDASQMSWDARGNYVTRTTTPDGVTTKVLARNGAGHIELMAQGEGSRYSETAQSYEYGLVTSRMRTAWSRQGQQLLDSSRLSETTRYSYDAQQRLTGITRADGTEVKTVFGADEHPERLILPDGGQVALKRDASGTLIGAAKYDGEQHLLQTVHFSRDSQQRLTGLKDDLGQIITLRYSGDSVRPTEVEHANAGKTSYTYDELGFITEQVRGAGTDVAQQTIWQHDTAGNVTSIDRGSRQYAIYDDFGRKLAQADRSHGVTLYVWDAADRLIAQVDESQRVRRFEYDPAGRLIATGSGKQAAQVRTRYDGTLASEVSSADGKGERKAWQYDSLGRLVQERHWLPSVSNDGKTSAPMLLVTALSYDDRGRLSGRTLTDAQQRAHRMTYQWDDATGHLRGIQYNGAPVVTDVHASWLAGISTFKHGNGVEERFERDQRGRLIRHVASAQQSVVDDRYNYDGADRLITTTQGAASSPARKQSYGYDVLGRLISEQYEGDTAGRLVANTYAYDKLGNRISSTIDGQTQRYAYADQRLLAVDGASARAGWATTYGPLGQPIQRWSLQPVAQDSATTAGQFKLMPPSARTVYGAGGQALMTVDDQDKVVAQYGWGLQGERVSKTLIDGSQHHTSYYLYQDTRTRPVVADTREQGAQLQAELDDHGAVRRQYVYLDGQIVAVLDTVESTGLWAQVQAKVLAWFGKVPAANAEIFAVHTDQRHAPVAVSDARGQVVWRATYTAFGQATVAHGKTLHASTWSWIGEAHADTAQTFELNLRLPGQYFDAERGLHYNLQRDYDPQTGRFMTADPISMQAGLDLGRADRLAGGNVYGYVSANPLTSIDTQGWYEEDVHYYTTFFLALVAGVDYNEAKIIALATQYVDDNAATQPINTDEKGDPEYIKSIWTNAERLKDYHFTLSDAATGQTEKRYDNGNYANPSSPQLNNLLNASKRAPTRCGQLQFYGEFLHAFEDTFGHRDKENKPIDAVWRVPLTDKQLGIGHGLYGHEPDKTYNDYLDTDGTRKALGWYTREDRTNEMNHEVYDRLVASFGDKDKKVPWEKVEAVMKSFNAVHEDDSTGFKGKFAILNKALKDDFNIARPDGKAIDFSTGYDPQSGLTFESYDSSVGATNRNKFLCDKDGKRLDQKSYRGTILPKDSVPCN